MILFSSFLLYLLYQEPSQSEKEKITSALFNSRAALYLDGLNENKIDRVKLMLEYDTVDLVYEYNEEIFKTSGLDRICKDWNVYIKDVIIKHLNDRNSSNANYPFKYYQQVESNMKILDNCKSES